MSVNDIISKLPKHGAKIYLDDSLRWLGVTNVAFERNKIIKQYFLYDVNNFTENKDYKEIDGDILISYSTFKRICVVKDYPKSRLFVNRFKELGYINLMEKSDYLRLVFDPKKYEIKKATFMDKPIRFIFRNDLYWYSAFDIYRILGLNPLKNNYKKIIKLIPSVEKCYIEENPKKNRIHMISKEGYYTLSEMIKNQILKNKVDKQLLAKLRKFVRRICKYDDESEYFYDESDQETDRFLTSESEEDSNDEEYDEEYDYIPPKEVEPVKKPEPTKKVELVKAPESTKKIKKIKKDKKKVEPVKAPEPTKKVEPVKAPEPTKKVEPVKAPEPTKKVEPIKAPDSTKQVEPIKKDNKKVEPVKVPELTKKAEPVKKPEPTKKIDSDSDEDYSDSEDGPDPFENIKPIKVIKSSKYPWTAIIYDGKDVFKDENKSPNKIVSIKKSEPTHNSESDNDTEDDTEDTEESDSDAGSSSPKEYLDDLGTRMRELLKARLSEGLDEIKEIIDFEQRARKDLVLYENRKKELMNKLIKIREVLDA